MAAIKRASSGSSMTTTMMMMNMEQRNQNHTGSNDDEQQQRYGRRRKLSHSRVRFSEEQPTIHPPASMEEEVIPPTQEVVKLWYSREDIQQFLVERSNLAILLMNLDGSLPLQISEEEESRGLCLRGFEQYFSTSVRQQILARRIEHRTMVLMEQYRQLTDMGHRDPSLLRACIQHISQPAIDEALIIAALDTRAISEDLATCRLVFPIPTTTPFSTSSITTSTTMMPLSESTTTSGNHLMAQHRRRVTPSPSFIDPSRTLKSSSSSFENNVVMTSFDGNSKPAPLSSLATSAMGNPVVIPLPNEEGLPSSLNLRFFIE